MTTIVRQGPDRGSTDLDTAWTLTRSNAELSIADVCHLTGAASATVSRMRKAVSLLVERDFPLDTLKTWDHARSVLAALIPGKGGRLQ